MNWEAVNGSGRAVQKQWIESPFERKGTLKKGGKVKEKQKEGSPGKMGQEASERRKREGEGRVVEGWNESI